MAFDGISTKNILIELNKNLINARVEKVYVPTKNDIFFLSLAIAIKEGKANIESVKKVLHNAFAELSFENLVDVLPIMGKGMLGIFVVIGIIIVAVYALGAFGKALSKKDEE